MKTLRGSEPAAKMSAMKAKDANFLFSVSPIHLKLKAAPTAEP